MSRVQQGSVLGPILRVIYINNLDSTISIADDTKLYDIVDNQVNGQS